jgi:protoporphyrinogen IX oxidase
VPVDAARPCAPSSRRERRPDREARRLRAQRGLHGGLVDRRDRSRRHRRARRPAGPGAPRSGKRESVPPSAAASAVASGTPPSSGGMLPVLWHVLPGRPGTRKLRTVVGISAVWTGGERLQRGALDPPTSADPGRPPSVQQPPVNLSAEWDNSNDASPYPWTKAFHVIAMVAWMAGLFYLPRVFVYHAERGVAGSELSETFKVMEAKAPARDHEPGDDRDMGLRPRRCSRRLGWSPGRATSGSGASSRWSGLLTWFHHWCALRRKDFAREREQKLRPALPHDERGTHIGTGRHCRARHRQALLTVVGFDTPW